MGINLDTQATRSTLMSVDTTLSANITASQDYIPIASTTSFSTSVVAEIETTNEVVSFTDISENLAIASEDLTNATYWPIASATITANQAEAPDGTTTADELSSVGSGGKIQQFWTGLTSGGTYNYSIYVKAKVAGFLRFMIAAGSGTAHYFGGWFNTSTGAWGTMTTNGSATNVNNSVTSVGDDWYRVDLTGILTGQTAYTIWHYHSASDASSIRSATPESYLWGAQFEEASAPTTYLPTGTSALVGLTGVTRGANGTTAQSASSGDSIQQLPYALSEVNMPTRLKGLSVTSDGTGVGRLTLCDKIGTTLCDVDIPDNRLYELSWDGGIIFPNGIYVANSDNITAYTLYTDKHSGAGVS